jgi:hypothetical protein
MKLYGKMKVQSLTLITSVINGANVMFTPRLLYPLTSAYTKVVWESEPVWTLRKNESSILPVMDRRFFGHPARLLDTILAELSNKQEMLHLQPIFPSSYPFPPQPRYVFLQFFLLWLFKEKLEQCMNEQDIEDM